MSRRWEVSGRVLRVLGTTVERLDALQDGTGVTFGGTIAVPVIDDESEPALFSVDFVDDRHYVELIVP
jgi:hypothetical protein